MEIFVKRLLITGAAGGLGRVMREKLVGQAELLRLSDVVDMGEAGPHEELVQCDLGDLDAVMRLVEGCDGILHLGGISTEASFSKILNANIVGMYNLYEAARAHGRPRIIFASSNHTIGFYRQDEYIDAKAPTRPFQNASASPSPASITTSSDRRRQSFASVPVLRSPATIACSPPGCRMTILPA